MEILLKIVAVSLAGVFATSALKKSLPDMSAASGLATGLVLVAVSAGVIKAVIDDVYKLSAYAGISEELIKPLIKASGIAIVAKISCDICRDAGMSSASSYIELCGGALALTVTMPLMMSVLRQIMS